MKRSSKQEKKMDRLDAFRQSFRTAMESVDCVFLAKAHDGAWPKVEGWLKRSPDVTFDGRDFHIEILYERGVWNSEFYRLASPESVRWLQK